MKKTRFEFRLSILLISILLIPATLPLQVSALSEADENAAIEDTYYLSSFSPDYYFEELDYDVSVTLTNIEVDTKKTGNYYKSTIHLTLQNRGWTPQEIKQDPYLAYSYRWDRQQYHTSFRIPDGVFVTNYYLDVAGTRKYGLLAERNSALWIYDEVVSRALDPGLVYYEGDYLTLRVFPFAAWETRYTGIEFLHKEPVSLTIDGHTINLAPDAAASTEPQYIGDNAIYLSAASKRNLPIQGRSPQYVFVVDSSKGSDLQGISQRLRAFCSENNIVRDEAVIYATNDRRKVISMSDTGWEQSLANVRTEGSFDFAAAVEVILKEYADADTYPVIIGVRSKADSSNITWPELEAAQLIPEISGYYMITGRSLQQYYFDSRSSRALDRLATRYADVQIDGETYRIRDNGRSEILLRDGTASGRASSLDEWETAVSLMAEYQAMSKLPEAERAAAHLNLVKSSFAAKVMLPVTSFIVLETKQQEERMLNFQKKLLESGDIESTFSENYWDSMDEYDDDNWEPDDDDGDNANPSTGGSQESSSVPGWLYPCLIIVMAAAVLCFGKKTGSLHSQK